MGEQHRDDFARSWSRSWQARNRLLSGTFHRLSLHCNTQRATSISFSSSESKDEQMMNPCWTRCEPEISSRNYGSVDLLEPCQMCLKPSDSLIIGEIYNSRRERQSSGPMNVPNSHALATLINSVKRPEEPSPSSDYASAFGNGLSPTMNSWTLGLQDFPPSNHRESIDENQSSNIDEESIDRSTSDDDESYEVLSFEAPPESSLYFKEFHHTTSEEQNHVCECCGLAFESTPNSTARRCFYYGKLFCVRCHVMDVSCIPARLVKHLDTAAYPVCRRAKSILLLNYYQGIFDIQNDNKNLYNSSKILNEIRILRMQFHHCYTYLFTCSRLSKENYDKLMGKFQTREHLYQSIHSYSIDDLLSLEKISTMLINALSQAKKHIHQCAICCQKGFICEICKNRHEILYPFDDSKTIGECSKCSNLYHRRCWIKIDEDCPKCYRIVQRRAERNNIKDEQ